MTLRGSLGVLGSRRVLAALLALGIALGTAACGDDGLDNGGEKGYVSQDGAVDVDPPSERRDVPVEDVAGETLDGDRLDVAELDADVVVLNVWGSWCAPCRAEAADLVSAYDELGAGEPDSDVAFVGIDIREPSQAAGQAFERRYEIPYPSIYDQGAQTLLQFGLPLVPPTTIVLDAQDRIAATVFGPLPSSGTLVDLVEDARSAS